ncbi:MAG: ABC transporter ATP-binding protein [Pseudomonadota bacterium]
MTPLIEIRGLCKTYPVQGGFLDGILPGRRSLLTALEGIDLDLAPGEIFSLVGESGSGKTTLGRTLLRLVEPTSGEIRFRGEDLLSMGPGRMRAIRRDLQMVFQDPWSSLNPRLTVGKMLSEVLLVHGIAKGAAARARVAELLDLVGLPAEAANRYPRHFSGGQRQRIGIARALAVDPVFIVADEPVSAVDVSVQAQIMNLLLDLRDRLGLTLLVIAHDLSVVRYVSDRVAVMYLGRIVETAPAADFFSSPRHPYTRGLMAAAPRTSPKTRRGAAAITGEPPSPLAPPLGCPFNPRCRHADAGCREAVPQLENLGGGHLVRCFKHASLGHHAVADN